MTTMWEYKIVSPYYGKDNGDDPQTLHEWMGELNRLGSDGWELIGHVELWNTDDSSLGVGAKAGKVLMAKQRTD